MRRPPRLVSGRQIASILMLVVFMVAVIVLKVRCGRAVGELFRAIEPRAGGASDGDAARP